MDEISIIIPCHNSEGFINNIISDLNKLTFKNFHVIFVDDSSKIPLKNVLKTLKIDFQYLVIEANCGNPGGSRNAGIPYIKGNFCYFVDSDDRISSTLLEYSIKTLKSFPNSMPMSKRKIIPIEKNPTLEVKYYTTKMSDITDMWLLGRTMFKSDIIKKYNLRFENLSHNEDFIFISEYIYVANITTKVKHTAKFYRTIREGSVCSGTERYKEALPTLIRKLEEWKLKKFPKVLIDALSGSIDWTKEEIKKLM